MEKSEETKDPPSAAPEEEEKKGDPVSKRSKQLGKIRECFVDGIKNPDSEFLHPSSTWDDEKLVLAEPILQALRESGYGRPSIIQAFSLPIMLRKEAPNLIAQSHNGSGKTLAFVIASLMRVDLSNKELQVLVFAHNRELVQQIYDEYARLNKHLGVEVGILRYEDNKAPTAQLLVGIPSKVKKLMQSKKIKLDALRFIVFDEADYFFNKNDNASQVSIELCQKFSDKVQYALFSATYPDEVLSCIKQIVSHAKVIALEKEDLTIEGIKQLYFKTDDKVDALKEIYKEFDNVQVIVFMNTRSFAVTLMNILKKSGYEAKLLMGGDMSTEERDEILKQFRAGSIHFLITTNLLARGIDVDGMSFVVNFDVPFYKGKDN